MKRHEQKLLKDIDMGGQFVFPDWFESRQLFEVVRHYNGFRWIYDDDGRRKKGDEIIPRTKVRLVAGGRGFRVFDSEGMYVMESIEV